MVPRLVQAFIVVLSNSVSTSANTASPLLFVILKIPKFGKWFCINSTCGANEAGKCIHVIIDRHRDLSCRKIKL